MRSRTISAVRSAPLLAAVLLAAAASSANVSDPVVIEAVNDPSQGTIYTASVAATFCGQSGTGSEWCDAGHQFRSLPRRLLPARRTKAFRPLESIQAGTGCTRMAFQPAMTKLGRVLVGELRAAQ